MTPCGRATPTGFVADLGGKADEIILIIGFVAPDR